MRVLQVGGHISPLGASTAGTAVGAITVEERNIDPCVDAEGFRVGGQLLHQWDYDVQLPRVGAAYLVREALLELLGVGL